MAKPPNRVRPSYQDVLDLLASEHVRSVERAIAAEVGMNIFEDYSVVSTSHLLVAIGASGMTPSDIKVLLQDRRDQIVAFGVRLLRDLAVNSDDEDVYPEGEEQDPPGKVVSEGLGIGFGVTYAIYYNFLANRTPAELRAFLRGRGIEYHSSFSQDLRRLFDESQ
jgi:hypothetical protein